MKDSNQRTFQSNEELSARALFGIFVGIVGTLLVLITATGQSLLFGWLFFLDRRLAAFRPDGPSLMIGLFAYLTLFAVVHQMGHSLTAAPRTSTEVRSMSRWTWRSTTAVCLSLFLMFATSVSIIATVHQVVWLLGPGTSEKRQVVKSNRDRGHPSLLNWSQQSAWAKRSNYNLRDILMGLHNYHDTFNMFPAGAIVRPDGRGHRGWLTSTIPFIAVMDPWSGLDRAAWDDPELAKYGMGALPFLIHPELGWHGQFDERGFALGHYAGNTHVFPNNRGFKLGEATDGVSNTIAIGEAAENFQPWSSPWNRRDPADGINDVPWGFGGPVWQNGAQFGLLDGTVRKISRKIDRKVLKALGTPAGGEAIDADSLK